MDEICRLCLKVSDEMACKLSEESKIKLRSLSIELHSNDSLPSFVCRNCFKILEDIQSFRENVIRNEYKLIQLLNNDNNSADFYANFRNKYFPVEILKTKIDDEDGNRFFDVSDNCEPINQLNIKYNSENDHEETTPTIFKIENVTDENNITNTIISKPETIKIKRKFKSYTNGLTETKTTCKSNEIENSVETEFNISDTHITEECLSNLKKPIDDVNETEVPIKDHKCLTCFKSFFSQFKLINHYKTVHNYNNKDLIEENCHQSESPKIALEDKDADKLSSTNKNEEETLKCETSENSERPYNCKICGRTFTSVYAIVRHGRAHGDSSLYCSHGCGYTTVYKGALRDHEKRHAKDFRYKCGVCGAGFHVKTWHDQHQNIHNNVKPFICDVCGMAFHMDRYLTSHRTGVHPEIGKGAKRYICPHCDLAFYNKYSFKLHLEEHSGKNSFLCDICGKVCGTSEQLKYHKNSHLGLKPFSCSVCPKKFAKKSHLTVHEKAHAGEKHLCQVCGKYFAQRSTLLRHNRKRHHDGITEDHDRIERKKIASYSNF